MSRTVSLTATFVALGVSLHVAPAETATVNAAAQPNVVVIMTDDQDVDSLPVMRHLMSRPHGSWVQFTHAYANVAICAPARAAMLTGQYAHNNGVIGNDGRPMDDDHTIAVWLDDAGYRTGLVGKYMNGVPVRGRPPPGWDYVWPAELGRRDVDKYTTAALNFLDTTGDDPFLLYLAYKGPHKNAKPPVRYKEASVYVPPERPNVNEANMSDKPAKVRRLPQIKPKAMVGWRKERVNSQRELLGIDDGVQAVIDALEEKGVLDNTIIIFLADNGFSWGSHRMTGKLCPYEECSNIPLLIRYPGSANRVDHRIVSIVDLTTTIADYANVVPTIPQDGRSLVPVLENPGAAWPDIALLERRGVNDFFGIRTPGWKYIEYASGEIELYDLTNDPYEMESVAGRTAYSGVQANLAQRLALMVGTYSVRGKITKTNGDPLPGVVVTTVEGNTATTAANGDYILSGLIPGTYTLTPVLAGYSFTPPTRELTIIDRDLTGRNFTGDNSVFTVSGTITYDGQPLAGVTVSAGSLYQTTTRADGTYDLTGLPRGTHTLTPQLHGYVFTPLTRTVTITDNNMTARDFTAARSLFSVSGAVTFNGQPLAGVTVDAGNGYTTTTGGNGAYTLPDLPAGSYTLTPSLDGYAFTPPSRAVTITNQDVLNRDFVATPLLFTIAGEVVVDGQPLSGVLISDGNGHSDTTDANGRFALTGLPPGDYRLTPTKAGYVFSPKSWLVTLSDADVDNIVFVAAQLIYAISGQVTFNGAPLEGVVVADGAGHSDTTNANGRYTLNGLAAGDYTITPALAGYVFSPPSRAVTLDSGDVIDVDFAATVMTYSVSGEVLLDGQPLAGVTVSDGNGQSDTTNANGRYTITGLPPGDYTLTPTLDGYTFAPPSRAITVTDGDLANEDFAATLVTYSISGRVTFNDEPLAGVVVSDGLGNEATTGDDGRYTLSGLTPGNYTLTPTLDGYTFSPVSLAITIVDHDLTEQDFIASV